MSNAFAASSSALKGPEVLIAEMFTEITLKLALVIGVPADAVSWMLFGKGAVYSYSYDWAPDEYYPKSL